MSYESIDWSRVHARYWRDGRRLEGQTQAPESGGVVTKIDGRTFVALVNCNGVLAVYEAIDGHFYEADEEETLLVKEDIED